MSNNGVNKTLEELIQERNEGQRYEDDSNKNETLIDKGKLRPSYELTLSQRDIKKVEGKSTYSFDMGNGTSVIWQPEAKFNYLSGDRDFEMKSREERIVILEGEKVIATADFTLYKNVGHSYLSLNDFFSQCDAESQQAADFANYSVGVFGLMNKKSIRPKEILVEFATLRVSKEYKGSRRWIEATNEFILRRFKDANCSYMLLRAFPMEYAGLLTEDLPEKHHRDFQQRQNAMFRYYEKNLEVTRLSDTEWFYRKL